MKKILMRVIFCIGIALCCFLPGSVFAATPTPTPTPEFEKIKADTVYMDVPLYDFSFPPIAKLQEIIDNKDPILGPIIRTILNNILDKSQDIFTNLMLYIVNEFSTVGTLNHQMEYPKEGMYARRLYEASTKELKPFIVQNKTRNAPEQPKRTFEITGYLCLYMNGELKASRASTETIKTINNPEMATELLQSGMELSSYDTLGVIKPNSDKEYDMRKEEVRTDVNQPLPCETKLNTKETLPKQDTDTGVNRFSAGTGFTIREIITNYINKHGTNGQGICSLVPCDTYQVVWHPSAAFQYRKNTCDVVSGKCAETDGEIGYEVTAEEENSGGYTPSFWPANLKKPDGKNGGADQKINVFNTDGSSKEGKSAFAYSSSIQSNLKNTFCMLTPLSKQGESELVNYDPENPNPVITPCIAQYNPSSGSNACGELPDSLKDHECSLCNGEMLNSYTEDGSAPNGLPPTMADILAKAASTYNVPPSSLLSVMYHEGGFSGKRFTGENAWTEENVVKWSTCGGMPNCSETGDKAQYPFGLFPYWFNQPEFKDAVLPVAPDRAGKTSLCNFMDAAFAAAKALQTWGNYPRTPAMCYGRPMTGNVSGSCKDPSWNENTVLQSHIGYYVGTVAFCPDGTMAEPGYPYINIPNYDDWVLKYYNAFKCN